MSVTAFVITGKDRVALAVLKLKTVQAELAAIELRRRSLKQCPINDDARCDVPSELPCNKARCPVWYKVAGGDIE